MTLRIILFYVLLFLYALRCSGQAKEVTTKGQLWFGYMTSYRFHENYSWWNDTHYVPGNFFVARTGLTRHYDKVAITAGYAYLRLSPSSAISELRRAEHRPWAQAVFSSPLSSSLSLTHRIRYDARFRQDVKEGVVQPDYSFINRIRFLTTLRKTVWKDDEKQQQLFVAASTEVLLHFGQNANNTFDQIRLQIAAGAKVKQVQYQLGYMYRYVQTGNTRYVANNTLTLWVTQAFKSRKMK